MVHMIPGDTDCLNCGEEYVPTVEVLLANGRKSRWCPACLLEEARETDDEARETDDEIAAEIDGECCAEMGCGVPQAPGHTFYMPNHGDALAR